MKENSSFNGCFDNCFNFLPIKTKLGNDTYPDKIPLCEKCLEHGRECKAVARFNRIYLCGQCVKSFKREEKAFLQAHPYCQNCLKKGIHEHSLFYYKEKALCTKCYNEEMSDLFRLEYGIKKEFNQ